MFSKLKAAWARLAGPAGEADEVAGALAVEYKGCRIRPTPDRANSGYQTSGVIERTCWTA